MRRIHTTFDLLEGHTIVAMLREHSIEAWLFDADFVRQDWFKAIAYGGYRILVDDEFVAEAVELLRQYRSGALALLDEHRRRCPKCAEFAGSDDPWPRRSVFLGLIVLPFAGIGAFSRWAHTPAQFLCLSALLFAALFVLPWFVIRYFKWRFVCERCRHRWRDRPIHSYGELARAAEQEAAGA